MILILKCNEIDKDMIEIRDEKEKILWGVVHCDMVFGESMGLDGEAVDSILRDGNAVRVKLERIE